MTLKRFVAIFAILTTLSIGTVSPTPARAISDTTVIVISSIAAYVAFVFIGAYIVYGRSDDPNPTLMPAPADFAEAQDARNGGVRPGHRCRQADGNLTLVCW